MNKMLLDGGYLNFEKLVMDNYLRIGLTDLEAVILIKLFYLKKETNYLSFNRLMTTVSSSKKELESITNNLMLKGILSFEALEVDGRLEESFKIDGFFTKLEQLSQIEPAKEFVRMVEENFNRLLSAREIEIVSNLNVSKDDFTRALIICLQNNVKDVNYLKKVIENDKRG